MGHNVIDPPGLRLDISYATGFVVETGLYSAYTCLFVAALPGMTKARRLKDSRSAKSAWVFLICSILMYVVATIHLVFAGFRFYKSAFLTTNSNGAIAYLLNTHHWEFLGLIVLLCIQIWLGDSLVIYRCYCVWDNNIWLVAVPICLLLCSIGINSYVIYWIGHPSVARPTSWPAHSIYPLAFIQNFMTTSLIILKIVLQHRESRVAGIVDVGSKLSLMYIVRIVIETAGIYTIQILLLNILFFTGDNFQYVILAAIIPSIGITFLLLALRIEASQGHKTTIKSDLGIRSSIIPRWLREPDNEMYPPDHRDGNSLTDADSSEQRVAVEGESGAESMNWDSEISSDSTTQPKATAMTRLSSDGRAPTLELLV